MTATADQPQVAGRYERRAVADLIPYPGNAWVGNIDEIAASLHRYGQYKPLVVQASTGYVLAGNHTRQAAIQLQWTHLDCSIVDVDDETAHRINLIDNRSQQLGDYDDALLAAALQDLPDLTGTGFDDSYLSDLLGRLDDDNQPGTGRTDPDDAPEPPAVALSQPGDVWTLGRHRLHVGDATDGEAWTVLCDGNRPDLLWTDPPYGVDYVGKTKNALTITNDTLEGEALQQFLGAALDNARAHCRPGAAVYIAAPAGPLFVDFALPLQQRGIWRQTLVWAKDQFVMGRSDYHYRHEAILYGWLPGAAHRRPTERTHDTVWEIPRPRRSETHPTMKPVELVARAIENSTKPGQLVVDPFAGSGSTLIACHQTGRQAALLELDPIYADVICRRWQQHTGIIPVRNGEQVDFEG